MITRKLIREGFEQFHFNAGCEEPWPGIYPVLHHIWTPDGPQLHDHPHDIEVWVRRGWAVEEDESGARWVRKPGDHYLIDATKKHRIAEAHDYWSMCFYGPTRHEWKMYERTNGDSQ